jgi:hypothetical protein
MASSLLEGRQSVDLGAIYGIPLIHRKTPGGKKVVLVLATQVGHIFISCYI